MNTDSLIYTIIINLPLFICVCTFTSGAKVLFITIHARATKDIYMCLLGGVDVLYIVARDKSLKYGQRFNIEYLFTVTKIPHVNHTILEIQNCFPL